MSVGHVARLAEAAGLPTVIIQIAAFVHHSEEMRLPRTVLTRHPMGRPLGAPGDAERHREVVDAALELLATAEAGDSRRLLEPAYRLASR